MQKEQFQQSFLSNPELCSSNHFADYPVHNERYLKKRLLIFFLFLVHHDVKSSNIILDFEFKAKIANFSLAHTISKAGEPESISAMVRTFGYMDPEFGSSRKINEKVDGYSFGVVLLELTTGRYANGADGHENSAQWAWGNKIIIKTFNEGGIAGPITVNNNDAVQKLSEGCQIRKIKTKMKKDALECFKSSQFTFKSGVGTDGSSE
uniref:non-specific serine/threonine protein kinase n=1 Tax=Leersia perrieri TaxID=77586 RepID=A0A0D9WR73_9ORYZ